MAKDFTFKEIASAKVSPTRDIVISKRDNEFILAQRAKLQEGTRETKIFLRGTMPIENIEGLYELRDALNEAICNIENNQI